jgi:hypothetical protein
VKEARSGGGVGALGLTSWETRWNERWADPPKARRAEEGLGVLCHGPLRRRLT